MLKGYILTLSKMLQFVGNCELLYTQYHTHGEYFHTTGMPVSRHFLLKLSVIGFQCIRFSRKRKTTEASKLVETQCWARIGK